MPQPQRSQLDRHPAPSPAATDYRGLALVVLSVAAGLALVLVSTAAFIRLVNG
ncbi:MAG TPA: hypothetical protein VFH97_03805 [Gemmatimonadales bacterium]|nr:hypothetical protein [Gemmatimonadales bacterium]